MQFLENCPFCGERPTVHRISGDERDGYADKVVIKCESCGCSQFTSGDTSKGGYADNSKVEAKAAAKWNRRVLHSVKLTDPSGE